MSISSGGDAPAPGMSVQRLHDQAVDRQHDDREGEAVAEDSANVEELEIIRDRVADAVRPPEQLDHDNDLPDKSESGAGRRDDIGLELRQDGVPEAHRKGEAVGEPYLLERRVERP